MEGRRGEGKIVEGKGKESKKEGLRITVPTLWIMILDGEILYST